MNAGARTEHGRGLAVSRRRFAGGAASLGLTAAALGLVGCSSSKNNAGGTKATAAAVGTAASASTAPSAATRAAVSSPTPAALDSTTGKPGGTIKLVSTGYRLLDAMSLPFYDKGGFCCSALLGQRWGQQSVNIDDFSVEPDLAQALPEQPDNLTYVYHLRSGVKFSNGRVVTADDVKYSLDRYANYDKSAAKSVYQVWYGNVTTPDPQTVVLKTKFPFGDTLAATAGNNDGYILAKEHEEGPDAVTTIVGSGPFILVSETEPVSSTYRKNPDYYLKPYPYFDGIQHFQNPDELKRNTDFTTRNTDFTWVVLPQPRDQIKHDRPDAAFQTYDQQGSTLFMHGDKPPFNDARVRQALSMGVNRKALRDAVMNGEGREDQFFSVAYKNFFGSSEVKDLGNAAKYWNYDVQSAKQLLAAAGIDKPIETTLSFDGDTGQWVIDMATLIIAQWKAAGFVNAAANQQPGTKWGTTTMVGQYDGMGLQTMTQTSIIQPSLGIRNSWYWGPNGEHSNFNLSYANDPQLSSLAEKQLQTQNANDRKQIYAQMQTIIAEQQYRLGFSTRVDSWFWNPSLRNVRMSTQLGSRRYAMRWWFAS